MSLNAAVAFISYLFIVGEIRRPDEKDELLEEGEPVVAAPPPAGVAR